MSKVPCCGTKWSHYKIDFPLAIPKKSLLNITGDLNNFEPWDYFGNSVHLFSRSSKVQSLIFYFSIFKTTCEYWQEDWFGSSKRRKFLPEIWMSRTSRWKVTVEKMLIIYTLAYLEFMPIKMRIGRRWRSTPILWPTLNHCALLQFACLVV